MEFERCRDILLRESELVKRIGGLQSTIHDSIVSRDWTDFEDRFAELDEMGARLAKLEREREALFPANDARWAGEDAESAGAARFYAFAARLPGDQRRDLSDAYRALKMETLRVRASGETLMGYIAGARATMAGFFEAAFPSRNAKTYSPRGTQASGDMRSMVLNQRF
ncbi:MAG: hypothetical protein FWE09_05085 [Treponema sp.]|nr:hypothetical protein [Treponema sp.]